MHILALALAAVVSSTHPAAGAAGGAAPTPEVTWSETRDGEAPPAPGTRFKCQSGGDLVAHFDTRGPRLIAVVDAGDGPHALPIQPWDRRTEVAADRERWRRPSARPGGPGVQIMWMDGGGHRMCGREGGHHH